MFESEFLSDGPRDARVTLVLAHGAGAAMDSPFMELMAKGLAEEGMAVLRFEFPYMAKRRVDGKKRGPDRAPVLLDTWRAVIAKLDPNRLVIGGKSLGGRIASMVAQEAGVRGLVCLGYPFHPPGKPERTRIEHLAALTVPSLILQGTRDPFGGPAEVETYELAPSIRVHWLEDGEHSFKPRKRSGRSERDNLLEAVNETAAFVQTL